MCAIRRKLGTQKNIYTFPTPVSTAEENTVVIQPRFKKVQEH